MDPGERAGQFKVFIRDRAGPLKERGVTQVVIAGVATSFGVESTARQAYDDGYNVTLAIDAMTDVRAESHEHSVTRVFPVLGETGSTADILALLDAIGQLFASEPHALFCRDPRGSWFAPVTTRRWQR
jgi:isochorismate hydrolase